MTPQRLAGAAAILALLAGCNTSSVSDFAPASATTSAVATPAASTTPLEAPVMGGPLNADLAKRNASSGPANSGSYPNLNIAPGAAAPQLTEAEATAKKAALKAEQAAVAAAAPAAPADEATRLKKLAASHAKDTLKEIEQDGAGQ
ncbi:MAG: hypothetical protein KF723_11580 [Rhizobiaceae bacterium]|nr:hypothetical protein [Rhizobiaceae bacterium]